MNQDCTHAPIIRSFNTHSMEDSVIEALMTGRERESTQMMAAIDANREICPGKLQHLILYGPRGFGKSFMARVAQIEAGKRSTDESPIAFVLLPEEQHNLVRNPHGFLDYVTMKLADLRSGADQSWKGAGFVWPDPDEAQNQWTKSVKSLENELDAWFNGRSGLAVIVVENFDMLLKTVFSGDPEQQMLRKWMTRKGNRCMILATATGAVDVDYEKPLFQAFQPIELSPWNSQDCIDYFNRRRAFKCMEELSPDEESKARAVADFIGGAPRLAQLLADVLDADKGFNQGDPLSVAEVMNALADKLADYYRRRIDDLPPLARGLLDALIRGGEPCSATELANRVKAKGQNLIARVIKDLQRADMIRGVKAPDGREILYRAADRVFVHFYRIRQGNQAALSSPLNAILDFLRAFYSEDERRTHTARYLDAGRPAEADVFARLAMEIQSSKGYNAYRNEFYQRLRLYLRAAPEAWPESPEVLVEKIKKNPAQVIDASKNLPAPSTKLEAAIRCALISLAYVLLDLSDRAEAALTEALNEACDSPEATLVVAYELSEYLFYEKKEFNQAIANTELAGKQADQITSSYLKILALKDRSFNLLQQGNYVESLDAASKSASLATSHEERTQQASAMNLQAYSLYGLSRFEEAIEVTRASAIIAHECGDKTEMAEAMIYQAFSFNELGRHEQAFEVAKAAAKPAHECKNTRQLAIAKSSQAYSLYKLGRYKEAFKTAASATEFALECGDNEMAAHAMNDQIHSLYKLNRYGEAFQIAEAMFEYAVMLDNVDLIEQAAKRALQAAEASPQPKVVDIFDRWKEKVVSDEDVSSWLFSLLCAVTRARAWVEFDDFIKRHKDWMTETIADFWFKVYDVGYTITVVEREEGRAAGFDAAQGMLSRLSGIYAVTGERSDNWFIVLILGFAQKSTDPNLIRDVAGLLTVDLNPQAPSQSLLLEQLATYEEAAENKEAVLARMDPDVALWIRRIRGLPEENPLPKKKQKRRKKSSKD
ncbi:MarR family transcriptional regulator [Desulfatibacillum aliphaticivorans]|uniref:MarR family transcriptional regulator n=1 Tax=Desulfatibacillum aliphaticivorans TaxID=218208 RepID=UPI0004255A62|nr:MarR family transcriptional regulator [Desulfatibacillum aliphaticivorans]